MPLLMYAKIITYNR